MISFYYVFAFAAQKKLESACLYVKLLVIKKIGAIAVKVNWSAFADAANLKHQLKKKKCQIDMQMFSNYIEDILTLGLNVL